MNYTIRLNGAPKEVPQGATIAEILDGLDLNRDGIAVAIDRQVVPRSEYSARAVHEGAQIEVIRAVGGG